MGHYGTGKFIRLAQVPFLYSYWLTASKHSCKRKVVHGSPTFSNLKFHLTQVSCKIKPIKV
jgi:hypothetical protein